MILGDKRKIRLDGNEFETKFFDYEEEDVKQFISDLKEEFENRHLFIYEHNCDVASLNKIVDKLVGDKLQ